MTVFDEAIAAMKKFNEALNANYRVVEYDGKFTIQRKRIVITKSGMLWWKKTDRKTVWDNVDKYGNGVFISYMGMSAFMCGESIDPLNSLKEAKEKIKVFSKGNTIHYVK